MQFISTQKFIRMSPRKLRLVADQIRPLTPQEAVEVLPLVHKRAATPLLKVVKSAMANATQAGVPIEELKFAEIQITEGPRLKRGRPVSRGRWHPILKRMSHIRVVLESIPKPKKIKTKKGKK
jgi:large subunit ribosomal protein L22